MGDMCNRAAHRMRMVPVFPVQDDVKFNLSIREQMQALDIYSGASGTGVRLGEDGVNAPIGQIDGFFPAYYGFLFTDH